MASCSSCGKTILFGGLKHAGLRYCGGPCLENGIVEVEAMAIPEEIVLEAALEMHRGLCPRCGGSGPVDVHTAHKIWSCAILSSWSSTRAISCRACGVRRQLGGLLFSSVLGWWGFPWGIFVTPMQIGKNLVGLFSPPSPTEPSENLVSEMRMMLAEQSLIDEHEKVTE